MIKNDPNLFYVNGSFEEHNPSWDSADSEWKAKLVTDAIRWNNLVPASIVEIGCGAGAILSSLRRHFPHTYLSGFDIAPGAAKFWAHHTDLSIEFTLGDFLEINSRRFDLLLMLDVIEHLANPHDFLSRAAKHADHFLFHIPLDLSAASVLREQPLVQSRRKVGHIHYFTKRLALELLEECGYEVLYVRFSGAYLRPRNTLGGKVANWIRWIIFSFNREVGVRLLGGDTLVVLARVRI